jgi:hypothetical protein
VGNREVSSVMKGVRSIMNLVIGLCERIRVVLMMFPEWVDRKRCCVVSSCSLIQALSAPEVV